MDMPVMFVGLLLKYLIPYCSLTITHFIFIFDLSIDPVSELECWVYNSISYNCHLFSCFSLFLVRSTTAFCFGVSGCCQLLNIVTNLACLVLLLACLFCTE